MRTRFLHTEQFIYTDALRNLREGDGIMKALNGDYRIQEMGHKIQEMSSSTEDALVAAVESGDLAQEALDKAALAHPWKLIGTVTGTAVIACDPSQYKELLLFAQSGYNCGSCVLPAEEFVSGRKVVSGGYWENTNSYGIYFSIDNNGAHLQSFFVPGAKDNVSGARFSLYGR